MPRPATLDTRRYPCMPFAYFSHHPMYPQNASENRSQEAGKMTQTTRKRFPFPNSPLKCPSFSNALFDPCSLCMHAHQSGWTYQHLTRLYTHRAYMLMFGCIRRVRLPQKGLCFRRIDRFRAPANEQPRLVGQSGGPTRACHSPSRHFFLFARSLFSGRMQCFAVDTYAHMQGREAMQGRDGPRREQGRAYAGGRRGFSQTSQSRRPTKLW